MQKLSLTLLAFGTALAITPAAMADSITYNYNFIGLNVAETSVDVALSVTANDAGGGVFDITGVTGTVLDTNNGISSPVTALIPGGPGQTTSSDGLWWYDDLLFPSGSAPGYSGSIFDLDGLLIDAGSVEINLWGNGGNNYTLAESKGGTYIQTGETVQLFPNDLAPEPSSLVLLGTGLLGLAFVLFRRHRPSRA